MALKNKVLGAGFLSLLIISMAFAVTHEHPTFNTTPNDLVIQPSREAMEQFNHTWGKNESIPWAQNTTSSISNGTLTEHFFPIYDGKQWYVTVTMQGYDSSYDKRSLVDNAQILMKSGNRIWWEAQGKEVGKWNS